ncbi:Uncharacterised protein [Mycobacteroides abscessus]|nr:Uncharacterised protein [Mycobacteroides abscessus]
MASAGPVDSSGPATSSTATGATGGFAHALVAGGYSTTVEYDGLTSNSTSAPSRVQA